MDIKLNNNDIDINSNIVSNNNNEAEGSIINENFCSDNFNELIDDEVKNIDNLINIIENIQIDKRKESKTKYIYLYYFLK